MKMLAMKTWILTMVLTILALGQSIAQCAMCRATVENNLNTGETSVGAGLNYGIFYLFLAPYVMAILIGFVWYRNYRKQKSLKSKVQHF